MCDIMSPKLGIVVALAVLSGIAVGVTVAHPETVTRTEYRPYAVAAVSGDPRVIHITHETVRELPVVTVRTETEYVASQPETVTRTETVNVPTGYTDSDLSAAHEEGYNQGYERGGATAYQGFNLALRTPCATEDSTNCYWNASVQGDGSGESFVTVGGVYYYLGGSDTPDAQWWMDGFETGCESVADVDTCAAKVTELEGN